MTRRNGRLGRKYNRRGGVSGMGMSAAPRSEKMGKNMNDLLVHLQYINNASSGNSTRVLRFQRDYNIVAKFHPEIGGLISQNGTYNSQTYGAMKMAYAWSQGLPNSWIFYVKKYRKIMGTGGSTPSAPGAGRRKPKRSKRRRAGGRRRYSGPCAAPSGGCPGGKIWDAKKCKCVRKKITLPPDTGDPLGGSRGPRLRATSSRKPGRRRLRRRSR